MTLPFDKDSSVCNQMAFPTLLPHSIEDAGRKERVFLSIVRKQELAKCSNPKAASARKPVWGK